MVLPKAKYLLVNSAVLFDIRIAALSLSGTLSETEISLSK